MLSKYLDFNAKHDMVGAFMFFIVHLILLTGVSVILADVVGILGSVESIGSAVEGVSIVSMIGSLFVLWLGGSILHRRGLTNDILSVIIVGVALYVAFTMSAVVGLVPIALLTTMGKK